MEMAFEELRRQEEAAEGAGGKASCASSAEALANVLELVRLHKVRSGGVEGGGWGARVAGASFESRASVSA